MAQVLGKTNEAEKYHTLFHGIRRAFVKNYVTKDGIIGDTVPGNSDLQDATEIVRAKIRDGKLIFTAKNEELGGDPAPNRIKNLHLKTRHGGKSEERTFVENSRVELDSENNQPLEIISASYGCAATDFGDTQGSYALALRFGLLDEPLRSLAARRLNELVVKNKFHPTTGFWSSIEMLLALSDSGYHETAARMLTQRDEPSWGHMAEQNTTMWEAFNAPARNLSLNHWTHSAVSDWFWRNIAGLNPDEDQPGYASFTIRPRPTQEVTWCKASYDSIRGKIVSDWKREGDQFTLAVSIPANTKATVCLPAKDMESVTESGTPVAKAKGIRFLRQDSGGMVFQMGAGNYLFVSKEK
jgi:hypothetical protein